MYCGVFWDLKSILRKHRWERWWVVCVCVCVCGEGDEDSPHKRTQVITSTRLDPALTPATSEVTSEGAANEHYCESRCVENHLPPLWKACVTTVRPEQSGAAWGGRAQGQTTQLQFHLSSCPHWLQSCPWITYRPQFCCLHWKHFIFTLPGTRFCLDSAGTDWPSMGALTGAPTRFRGNKGEVWKLKMFIWGPKGQVYSIHGHTCYLCQPCGDPWG